MAGEGGQGKPVRNLASEANRIRANGGVIQVTILSGVALSDVIELHGRRILAMEMPAGWTAAAITFNSGSVSTALHPVYDDAGTEISAAVEVDRIISITGSKADALASLDLLQLRSGTVGTPVNQGADRIIKLLVK